MRQWAAEDANLTLDLEEDVLRFYQVPLKRDWRLKSGSGHAPNQQD